MAGSEANDYSDMSWSELEDIIKKKIHKMEDHKERMEHTKQAVQGYHSDAREDEYSEFRAKVETGKTARDMVDMYDGLRDAQKGAKNKKLEETVVTDWLKKFSEKIMPALHLGAEGHAKDNYDTLMVYLESFDQYTKAETPTINKIREDIKRGRGAAATAKIIEAITKVKKTRDINDFMTLLIPADHPEFREHAAKTIAEETEKQFGKKEKSKYRISADIIAQNLPFLYQHYAAGDYNKIKEAASVEKGKKEGKSAD